MAKALDVPLIEIKPVDISFDIEDKATVIRDKQGNLTAVFVNFENRRYNIDLEDKIEMYIPDNGDIRSIELGIDILVVLDSLMTNSGLSEEEQIVFAKKVRDKVIGDFLEKYRSPSFLKFPGGVTMTLSKGTNVYDIRIEPMQRVDRKTYDYDRTSVFPTMTEVIIGLPSEQWPTRELSSEEISLLLQQAQTEEEKVFLDLAKRGMELKCDPEQDDCPDFNAFDKAFTVLTDNL